jgi:bacterioferritin-associated ferredoxin
MHIAIENDSQEGFTPVIVCLCHGVSERAVDDCVDAGARSVEEVGLMSGAGMGCGACHCQISDRLKCPALALLRRESRTGTCEDEPRTAA